MNTKPRKVMSAEERKDYILENGARLAEQIGIELVTARLLSSFCKVNTSVMTIRHYYNNQKLLQEGIANSRFATKSVKEQARRA